MKSMKLRAFMITCVLALSACQDLTREQRTMVGAVGGAAAGMITADALKADDNWRVIAVLAGAAAGTIVAQNSTDGRCAYARGDGTYYKAACQRR